MLNNVSRVFLHIFLKKMADSSSVVSKIGDVTLWSIFYIIFTLHSPIWKNLKIWLSRQFARAFGPGLDNYGINTHDRIFIFIIKELGRIVLFSITNPRKFILVCSISDFSAFNLNPFLLMSWTIIPALWIPIDIFISTKDHPHLIAECNFWSESVVNYYFLSLSFPGFCHAS